MKAMDLFGASSRKRADPPSGHEVAGMVSIYLVRLSDGKFYVDESTTTQAWSSAKFFFTFNGMLEAKDIASRLNGSVFIVNCTQPAPYNG